MNNLKLKIILTIYYFTSNFSIYSQNALDTSVSVKEFAKFSHINVTVAKSRSENKFEVNISNGSKRLQKDIKLKLSYDPSKLAITRGTSTESPFELKIPEEQTTTITIERVGDTDQAELEVIQPNFNKNTRKWEWLTDLIQFNFDSSPKPDDESNDDESNKKDSSSKDDSSSKEENKSSDNSKDNKKKPTTPCNTSLQYIDQIIKARISNLFYAFEQWWNRSDNNYDTTIIKQIKTEIGREMELKDVFIISGTQNRGDKSSNLNRFLEKIDALRWRYNKTVKYLLSSITVKQGQTKDKDEYVAYFYQTFTANTKEKRVKYNRWRCIVVKPVCTAMGLNIDIVKLGVKDCHDCPDYLEKTNQNYTIYDKEFGH